MQTCASAPASSADEGRRFELKLRGIVRHYWHFVIVITLALLLWAPRLSGSIDLRWDAGVYYVLAASLATGHGYRIISEPGAPEAVQYPPLLPGIVALFMRASGSTDPAIVGPWLRLAYAAIFLLYGVAILALARLYLPPLFALAVAILSLLHHSTIFLSDTLFTEIPFLLVTVAFMFVAGAGGERRLWHEAFSFFLSATAFLLRTAGVVLLVSWVIDAIFRRKWRLAVIRLLLVLIPIGLWQTHVARVLQSDEYRHPAYEYQRAPYQFYNVTYADNMLLVDPARPELGRATPSILLKRLLKNGVYVIKAAGESMTANGYYWRAAFSQLKSQFQLTHRFPAPLVTAFILALVAAAVTGFALLIRQGKWLIPLYVAGALVLVCLAPWRFQFQRYLSPVAPFLLIGAAVAFSRLLTLSVGRYSRGFLTASRIVIGSVLLVLFPLEIYSAVRLIQEREPSLNSAFAVGTNGARLFYHDQSWRGWDHAIAWIRENASPRAIVATSASHYCFLQTGRRAVSPPVESNPERARRLLDEVPVSYVIVDRGKHLPAVDSDRQDWLLVGDFDGTRLYARK